VTDVYVRWNKFVGDGGYKRCREEDRISVGSIESEIEGGAGPCESEPVCSELSLCPDTLWEYDGVNVISCESLLVVDNKVAKLTGGGPYKTGVPPVYVGFQEPLYIKYADVRIGGINGQKAPELVVDGVTRHTFVVEVKFSGKPVPDGTQVFLTVEETGPEGAGAVVLSSNLVYTHQTYDPLFDPLEQSDRRSLAYFEIEPLPNTVTFNSVIKATTRYDRRGDAQREMSASVKIVAVAYADDSKASVTPFDLPDISQQAKVDGILIDTRYKNGHSIFDSMPVDDLGIIFGQAQKLGLMTAIAGSVGIDHIKLASLANPDFFGVRSAIINGGDRTEEGVNRASMQLIRSEILKISAATCSV